MKREPEKLRWEPGMKVKPCFNPYKHPSHTWTGRKHKKHTALYTCPGKGRGAH